MSTFVVSTALLIVVMEVLRITSDRKDFGQP
jgi:hypothetical protein